MTLTYAEVGVLMLAAFGTFHFLRILHRTRAVLAFVGVCLVGTAGWVGNISSQVIGWAMHTFGSAMTFAFGTAAAAALFLVLVIIFVKDLHPRYGERRPRTAWIGLALGLILVAGASGIPALGHIPQDLRHGVQNTTSAVVKGGS